MKKQFSSFLLLLLMAIILPQQARAERIYKNHLVGSDCIYWEISSDGVLHIAASGKKVEDVHIFSTAYADEEYDFELVEPQIFPDYEESPFIEYKDQITAIDILADEYGAICNIGKNAFKGLSNVTYVKLNAATYSIGEGAFEGCSSLVIFDYAHYYFEHWQNSTSVHRLHEIGARAFKGCSKLEVFEMPFPDLEIIGDEAFMNCRSLTKIPNSDKITKIGQFAFYGSGIKGVKLPSLTSVGQYAFAACNVLQSISNLGSITTIPEGMFKECGSLNYMTNFPTTVTTLGKECFARTYFVSFEIPTSVQVIHKGVLAGCDHLGKLTIPRVGIGSLLPAGMSESDKYQNVTGLFGVPNSDYYEYKVVDKDDRTAYVPKSLWSITVTSGTIPDNAFYGMQSLERIVFGDDVKFDFATAGAFEDCTKLTSLMLPQSTIYSTNQHQVGDRLFRNCSKLTSLLIPSTITEIGEYAFDGCTNLQLDGKFLHVNKVKTKAFGGCNALTTFDFDKDANTDSYLSSSAFKNCSNLKHIGLNQVKIVAAEAFSGCHSLTDLTATENMTAIAKCAFQYCTSLDMIEIPANVVDIYEDAFDGCSSLKTIKVNRSTAYDINDDAFDGRTYTNATVYVPNADYYVKNGWKKFYNNGHLFVSSSSCGVGLTYSYSDNGATLTISGDGHGTDYTATDGEGAAPWSTSDLGNNTIKKIVFDGNIRSIGARMFSNLYALEEVVLPNSVTRIGDGAFWQCKNLKRVLCYGNSQLESIGRDAFFNCQKLEEVALPSKLKTIGKYAFRQCYALTNIDLPSSLESIGQQAFLSCKALRKVAIPYGVELANGVFTNCTSLAEATLSSDAASIPQDMFYGCSSLNSITIPASVRTIDKDAFAGCSSLFSIKMENTECPTLNSAAFDASTKASAYLYTNNKTDYAADEQWGQFQNICALIQGDKGRMHYELDKDELIITGRTGNEEPCTLLSLDYNMATLVKKVTIKGGVSTVFDSFFAGLQNLETADCSTVSYFGNDVFVDCPNLKSIYVKTSDSKLTTGSVADSQVYANAKVYSPYPDALKSNAKWSAFGDNIIAYDKGECGYFDWDNDIDEMEDATYLVMDDKLTITVHKPNARFHDFNEDFNPWGDLANYIKTAEVVFDEGCSVTAIPARMFEGLTQLKSVTLPEGITTIGDYAFNGCTAIDRIEFPSTVTTLGDYSFYGCEALVNVDLGNCQTIGEMAFGNCTALTDIFIPGSMTSIDENAFDGCTNLETLVLYSPTIAGADYSKDRNLLTRFPNTKSLIFGPNVTSIGESAFDGRMLGVDVSSPLETIVFQSAPTIGGSAFRQLANLTNISGDVKSMGNYAFYDCPKLQSISITDATAIGSGAFAGCTSLAQVSLPSNLEKINVWAFKNCTSLETIELPSTVTSINAGFYSCTGLKKVIVHNTKPITISANVFSNVTLADVELLVPYGSVEEYGNADVWKDFNIKEEGIVELVDGTEYSESKKQDCYELTYTRTFNSADSWQALYIPFGMNYSDWSENFEIARINDVHQWDNDEDGEIDETIVETVLVKDNIVPNTPYLIKAKAAGTQSIKISKATLYAAKEDSYEVSSWNSIFTFTGTYSGITGEDMVSEGYYALGGGALHQASSADNDLSSFRWYMSVTDRNGNPKNINEVKVMMRGDDGTLTDIRGIENLQPSTVNHQPSIIHNLSGSRVSKMTKGIYIKNGKKYFVK